MSAIDLRDAHNTLQLANDSQKYYGITPHYGSDTYLYQKLGMGINVLIFICQTLINMVFDEIRDKKHFLVIMDEKII